jgi:hypothetical protein
MKCCVYSRFYKENNYIDSFIEHYLNLGFDLILILLVEDNNDYKLNLNFVDKVTIINVENKGNKLLDMYKNQIPDYIDWILSVDSDEYLMLNKRYKNIKDYLKINYTDENINIFPFFWVLTHRLKTNTDNLYNLFTKYKKYVGYDVSMISSSLQETKRRQLSKKVYCKCLFKNTDVFYKIEKHMPVYKNINRYIYFNNEVFYEKDKNKITSLSVKKNYYEDAFILHLETRSFTDLIKKSLTNHGSMVVKKKVKKVDFYTFLDNINKENNYEYKYLLGKLKNTIGYKLKHPYNCKNDVNNILNIDINNYNINNDLQSLNSELYKDDEISLQSEKYTSIFYKIYEIIINDDNKFLN